MRVALCFTTELPELLVASVAEKGSVIKVLEAEGGEEAARALDQLRHLFAEAGSDGVVLWNDLISERERLVGVSVRDAEKAIAGIRDVCHRLEILDESGVQKWITDLRESARASREARARLIENTRRILEGDPEVLKELGIEEIDEVEEL